MSRRDFTAKGAKNAEKNDMRQYCKDSLRVLCDLCGKKDVHNLGLAVWENHLSFQLARMGHLFRAKSRTGRSVYSRLFVFIRGLNWML